MNIREILDDLILKFPVLKPLLSNILSAEIRKEGLVLIYPDFLKGQEESEILNRSIEEYLWVKKNIKLEYFYRSFIMPHLPHPAVSSKFNNKLFFLKFVNANLFYTIIDKRKLYDFFSSGEKNYSFLIKEVKVDNKLVLFDLLEEILREILPELRDEFKYLHPLIVIRSFDEFFYFDMLFENVFKFLSDKKKIIDARRFIGIPCYSLIDYFVYFGSEK